MSKKRKIAFVGNSALTMWNFRAGVMKALAKDGNDITIIARQDSDIKPCLEAGIHYIPIDVDCKGKNPLKEIKLYHQFSKIYKNENFDLIFHYTIKPIIYGSLAATAARAKHISVVTGLGYTFIKKNWLFRLTCFLYRTTLRKTNEVWFLNKDDKNVFVQLGLVKPNKTFVLNGEGIDTCHFATHSQLPQQCVFLYIGRMLRYKGVELFAEAARRLSKDYPNAKWQLLGSLDIKDPSGISKAEIENWVQDGIVEYLGSTRDVRTYIEQSTCIVLPSYFREGVPRVLMEAAAMSRPIITTDSVGCREVVDDCINGLLCKPNDIDCLVEAMRKILAMSNEELTNLGKAGRGKMIREFDEKLIIEKYRQALQRYA